MSAPVLSPCNLYKWIDSRVHLTLLVTGYESRLE